ncbi:uncharacterized protein LOC116160440 [Photinus pyralis]|uniref:uncharacterized protein LOC116160440 n=1 Tax=Photinus pyralis TaxID=7054 RepID=UPI0012676229|nr:uncharacterized protein LOC116160440 [Photinus pyralis]
MDIPPLSGTLFYELQDELSTILSPECNPASLSTNGLSSSGNENEGITHDTKGITSVGSSETYDWSQWGPAALRQPRNKRLSLSATSKQNKPNAIILLAEAKVELAKIQLQLAENNKINHA